MVLYAIETFIYRTSLRLDETSMFVVVFSEFGNLSEVIHFFKSAYFPVQGLFDPFIFVGVIECKDAAEGTASEEWKNVIAWHFIKL